jgi:hypothetical protein
MQRIFDVVHGYLQANRRPVLMLVLILGAWALGAISPGMAAMGGVVLGLGWSNTLTFQTAVGTLFNTFTVAKSVINATNLVALLPNTLYVGKKYRVTVRGALSNIVTTPGTVTFQIMMGAIVVWTSGPIQLNATAHTLLPFNLVVDLRCDSIGAGVAAKFLGMGILQGIQFTLTAGQVDAVNTAGAFAVPATAPAVGTGFDSTIQNLLDFWTGFSISNAGNGVQLYDYMVEELN